MARYRPKRSATEYIHLPKTICSVLVFTPVYRLEPETIEAVFALSWDGPIARCFQTDNPYEDGRENVLHQYQRGRDMFLNGDWDAMMVIESDIIPPPDAIERLAAIDSDVAYGVYRFRVSDVVNVFERYPGNPRNEGESLSLNTKKLRRAIRANITPMTGGGLGCSLIKRHVLEAIPFRHEDTGHCDSWFNRDVMRHGFTQMADMRVVCGHKDEKGEILWPRLS